MAITRKDDQTQAPANNASQRGQFPQKEEAVAWLNIEVQTANGEWITVPASIPMLDSKNVHKGMVNKAKSDPDFEFQIRGRVHIPTNVVPEF
ncbi:hypothetical protein [Vibrio phage BUCT194]|uniref:Uncharacterized protein n=1 Tax=Vibrio phage BUCT194 TaxID=2859072 RepID=A0AAE8XFV6_9CAUD|nr:hypothetical protein PP741_gp032 [Vibrio phage BUCT194]UAW01193.1 hypothetical protein [Vibrio phage BUCT194]